MPSNDSSALGRALLIDAFERVRNEVPTVVEGLSLEQLVWRPDAQANPIAWLIWHLARVQDDHLAALSDACGRPRDQVWQVWRESFGLPYDAGDIGYGHTSEDVGRFAVEDPGLLTGYHSDVHQLSIEVITQLTAQDYERVVDESWDPPVTAAQRCTSVVHDITAHVGQAAYVKGLLERRADAHAGREDTA